MSPDPWIVGNGNDPYGPNFNDGIGPPVGRSDHTTSPSRSPTSGIYDIAGKINQFNAAGGEEGRKAYRRVALAHITKFVDGKNGISGANDDVAPGQHGKWNAAAGMIEGAATTLSGWVSGGQGDQIQGATARSILDKLRDLQNSLAHTAGGAHRMDFIVDMFSQDMSRTKEWFMSQENDNIFLNGGQDAHDALDWATQVTIRDSYNPPIDMIGYNHPDLPPAPPVPNDPTGTPTGMPAGGAGGSGGGLPVSGMGIPTVPAGLTVPSAGDPAAANPANALSGVGDAAKGAGDAAQQAGQGAQQAAQQAANAGQQGANAGQQALSDALKKHHGKLPEGVLGLGPKGLSSAGKSGGAGGARAGGSGGARTPGIATAQPTPNSAAASRAVAPASRAGIGSGGAGAPGAGAPAAGHRGGSDKVHKVSKALHHDKHGVVSEGEAVVQVVGEDPKEPTPGTSN